MEVATEVVMEVATVEAVEDIAVDTSLLVMEEAMEVATVVDTGAKSRHTTKAYNQFLIYFNVKYIDQKI